MAVRWTSLASLTRRASPNYWDVIAFTMIVAVFVVIANGSRGMVVALPPPGAATVSLHYGNLPHYALRTVLRMFIALAFSFLFTFTYATLAAKSRRAEMVLIPILDVLQSVPVLGFLSFTVTVFTGAFPGSTLGPECAAIFAIFTSQAWNMAFSFYQSLRTVPRDLDEVARGFRLTPWQRFWSLEVPFAIPGLLWNTMMSMSGGWFFVVASEAISVGNTTIKLPGIGSYLALAIEERHVDAVVAAVAAMSVVILLYDQLLFRPVVAWASKFRVELSASQIVEESWVLRIFQRARGFRFLARSISRRLMRYAFWRAELPVTFQRGRTANTPSRIMDVAWFAAIGLATAWSAWKIAAFVSTELSWSDLLETIGLTSLTLLRVDILPGIFPYYVTGALTASGGSWNASIVAEYVRWGQDKVAAHGIGAYIARATEAGDYPQIVLGVTVMSVFVILFNRLFWRPLFAYAGRRLRLD